MFWKKKKPPDEQVRKDMEEVSASLVPKWKLFCEKLIFKENVHLADQIEAFATPAMAYILENYPTTKTAPPVVLWMLIFRAVQESNTHTIDELNDAVSLLEAKFGNG